MDEELNTQTISAKYSIVPRPGMLLYPEDVERDDWLHSPDPDTTGSGAGRVAAGAGSGRAPG
jgi:hypothetical protein